MMNSALTVMRNDELVNEYLKITKEVLFDLSFMYSFPMMMMNMGIYSKHSTQYLLYCWQEILPII